MLWQLLTAFTAFLFTGRVLMFLLGLILGGMLTVASTHVLGVMTVLVNWWQMLLGAILG